MSNTALLHSVIAAGLSDPDIKKAVLEYLKAETEKAKPKQDWREVWHQLGDEIRRYTQPGIDPTTGVNYYSIDVQLYLTAQYHDEQRVVKLYAEMIPETENKRYRWRPVWERYYMQSAPYLWQKAVDAPEYTDAILIAQAAWTEALEWFVQQTEAVGDE